MGAEAMVGMLIAVEVHSWLLGVAEDPLQTKSLPAGAECCNEEEEQKHRPCREGYVEVVDETHIHPVHRVSHR